MQARLLLAPALLPFSAPLTALSYRLIHAWQDPVVSACGHDCCQLCFQLWTVDQGKRSCPVCRAALVGGPAAPLPGVCLRLQRTLEQIFPEVTGLCRF